MQPCGGSWAVRRLLASPAHPPADQSMDAQQAHLETVLGATATVLLIASVFYLALSALHACLRAARVISTPPGNDDPAPGTREDTKRALAGIPMRVVVLQLPGDAAGGRKEDADDCAVCLVEYAAGEEVRVLPACRHGFHRECVDRWLLTRAPTCPVCRAPLAAPVEDNDAGKDDCASGTAGIVVSTAPVRSRRRHLWSRLMRAHGFTASW